MILATSKFELVVLSYLILCSKDDRSMIIDLKYGLVYAGFKILVININLSIHFL